MNKANNYNPGIYFTSIIVTFLSYGPLTFVVVLCTAFLLFGGINITGGNLDFSKLGIPSVVLNWFGIYSNGSYNESDLMVTFLKLSMFGAIIGLVFRLLYKKIRGKEWNSMFLSSYKFMFLVITAFFVFAVGSAFMPQSLPGAKDVIFVLVIFWVVAIIAAGFYKFLNFFSKMIKQINPT